MLSVLRTYDYLIRKLQTENNKKKHKVVVAKVHLKNVTRVVTSNI